MAPSELPLKIAMVATELLKNDVALNLNLCVVVLFVWPEFDEDKKLEEDFNVRTYVLL